MKNTETPLKMKERENIRIKNDDKRDDRDM